MSIYNVYNSTVYNSKFLCSKNCDIAIQILVIHCYSYVILNCQILYPVLKNLELYSITKLIISCIHRRQKGWGYGAAAPPDFGVLHRILSFCNRNIVWSVNWPNLI